MRTQGKCLCQDQSFFFAYVSQAFAAFFYNIFTYFWRIVLFHWFEALWKSIYFRQWHDFLKSLVSGEAQSLEWNLCREKENLVETQYWRNSISDFFHSLRKCYRLRREFHPLPPLNWTGGYFKSSQLLNICRL